MIYSLKSSIIPLQQILIWHYKKSKTIQIKTIKCAGELLLQLYLEHSFNMAYTFRINLFAILFSQDITKLNLLIVY
jgi:hypothetical protein